MKTDTQSWLYLQAAATATLPGSLRAERQSIRVLPRPQHHSGVVLASILECCAGLSWPGNTEPKALDGPPVVMVWMRSIAVQRSVRRSPPPGASLKGQADQPRRGHWISMPGRLTAKLLADVAITPVWGCGTELAWRWELTTSTSSGCRSKANQTAAMAANIMDSIQQTRRDPSAMDPETSRPGVCRAIGSRVARAGVSLALASSSKCSQYQYQSRSCIPMAVSLRSKRPGA